MDKMDTGTEIVSYGNGIYSFDQMKVRAFLIVGTERSILLDTGAFPVNLKAMVNGISELPLTVIITHRDGDHIANLELFDEAYAHAGDTEAILAHPGCGSVKMHALDEGQIFDIGNRKLKVLYTPGHTKGSVCLLDEENRLLFSGDTISYGPVYMFGDKRNMQQYLDTLNRLKAMKDQGVYDTVYCCHNKCPISAETVEDLISCTEGILNGSISGEPVSMVFPNGEKPFIGESGTCGILFDPLNIGLSGDNLT